MTNWPQLRSGRSAASLAAQGVAALSAQKFGPTFDQSRERSNFTVSEACGPFFVHSVLLWVWGDMQGTDAGSAFWCTNVGGEHSEVLIFVLTVGELTEGL